MSFKYLENISLAEAAFEAKGKTLKELFESCADAFIDTTADSKTIKEKIQKKIEIKEENTEKLLFEFLDKLIFLKDAESLIFKKIKIEEINEKKIKAILIGDKIKAEEQKLRADIKAITMHKFQIQKTKTEWKAMVVMDI
jgi:SHS2 domain-containing protein